MITVREYRADDFSAMAEIWNDIVNEGEAFPQEHPLSLNEAAEFFGSQSRPAVAESDGEIVGLYILHPNNVGRCSHIANASYAVSAAHRGLHIGEALVRDCIKSCAQLGFCILQFNAVVSTNLPALRLYEKLGFTKLGVIPCGFRRKDGSYADIIPHYISCHQSADIKQND